jgi:hypothetical protein
MATCSGASRTVQYDRSEEPVYCTLQMLVFMRATRAAFRTIVFRDAGMTVWSWLTSLSLHSRPEAHALAAGSTKESRQRQKSAPQSRDHVP